jgi:hypothetical protein
MAYGIFRLLGFDVDYRKKMLCNLVKSFEIKKPMPGFPRVFYPAAGSSNFPIFA